MRDILNSLVLITSVAPRKREGSSPTGLVGRNLARQLLDAGHHVRILAEPDQLSGWPANAEIICGSVTCPVDAAPAFQDVSSVFLAGALPSSVGQVLEHAATAGVQRVVLLSSHGPEFEIHYPPQTWFWLAIEKAVEASGMDWAHIRPSAVMGAALEGTYPATGSDWPQTIGEDRCVREAYLYDGYYPFIHEADLASVAVAALLRSDLTGKILEAVGLPLSTLRRVAAIEMAIGEPIRRIACSPDVSRMVWIERGWPESAIQVTLAGLETYSEDLHNQIRWTLNQRPTVSDIIGREPASYESWAVEQAVFYKGPQGQP